MRWGVLGLFLIAIVLAHGALAGAMDGSGSEAVGVALGPGTPASQALTVAAYVAARLTLYFGAPAAVTLCLLWPRRRARSPATPS